MKLNLLPTSVSKAGAAKGMWFVAGAVALLGILGMIGLTVMGQSALSSAKLDAESKMAKAANAKATADHAEAQIAEAAVINRNQKLSEAMIAHNRTYVDLYAKVLSHVPAYYRLDSISATPVSESSTTVTLTGYIQSFRQYADLSIALWKIPNATAVTRAGYQLNNAAVPALTEADQTGLPIKPGQSPLPTDPLERMNQMIANAASEPRGFLDEGNFGSAGSTAKGAMPGYSQVTMTVVLAEDIRTPDPRATIAAGGGAAAGATAPPNGFGAAPGSVGRGGSAVRGGR
jgi:Tfp pilus assembly protein PilN